jgi:RNA polymerase sigma-70 factor, ECF subfamily
MKSAQRRSSGVNSAMTLPAAASARHALDFDALYRAARAFRKRKSYDSRRGSERSWLFGIARNAALDELRRRQRTAALVTEPVAVTPAPDEELERTLRRAAVRTALDALPARDHELIALKFHAGLDNAELAEVLGVSVSNAGTRLHRALTKLREILDDQS